MDVKVKICGVTSIEDAEQAVEAGADAIGLMFHPGSPRFITLEQAQVIERRLPAFILRVGVFADAPADNVIAAMNTCGLNLLQFHGNETPEFCRQFGMMTMKAFRVRDTSFLAEMAKYDTDAFLLDSHVPGRPGGTGQTFNWTLAIDAVKLGKPVFLAGGLTAANVAEAVRTVAPYGVDVSSGVESAPGKKDPQKMRDFIAAVKAA